MVTMVVDVVTSVVVDVTCVDVDVNWVVVDAVLGDTDGDDDGAETVGTRLGDVVGIDVGT